MSRKPTPSEVVGRFFKKGAPNNARLRQPGDPGFPLHVSGKVFNTCGDLVEGARIDIWQANHEGRYAPPASAGSPAFHRPKNKVNNCFGRLRSGAELSSRPAAAIHNTADD